MKYRWFAFSALFVFVTLSPVHAQTYDIDPAHTRIGFAVRHMVISEVRGEFLKFTGSFDLDKDRNLSRVEATIHTASLNTRVEKRDNHLRSPDFFDVEKYPTMTFVSKSITQNGSEYTVNGDLTIKDVTKSVSLKGELLGQVVDQSGSTRVGFRAQGSINRMDYGVRFHALLETGELVVAEKVTITLDVEGIKRK